MMDREQINFSSDQAVSALMGLEIRDSGTHPVFYWGVQYAGSFEPHLLSLVFRVFPAALLTYRLTMLFLLGSAVALVAAATTRAFGRTAGLISGFYLALGPSFLFFKTLTSDGAYASFLAMLGAALFFATWLAEEQRPSKIHALLLALGASVGLAWWILPLSAAVAPMAVVPLLREPRRWFRPSRIASLFAGFITGSLPWWVENFRTGFGSLKSAELAPATRSGIFDQFDLLLLRGLPVLLGGRSPGAQRPTFPGSEAISVGLFFVLIASGIALVVRETLPSRRFLAAASVGFLIVPALLCLTVARTNLREDPRYLLATYLGLAPLSGILLARFWHRRNLLPAILLTSALVLFGPLSQIQSPSYKGNARHGKVTETREAAKQLSAAGIHEIYAEYWTAYRLSFLSDGLIVASPFGEGAEGPIRSGSALRIVNESTHPGFLFEVAPASRLKAYLESRSAPYKAQFVDALALELVTGLPREELAALRRCRCIPAVLPPSSVR